MSLFDSLRYHLRLLTRSREHERELAEDMDQFVDASARREERVGPGAPVPERARRAARQRFGNATYYREEVRRISGLEAVDVFAQDLRFALRTFRRTPVFTAVAVATLAIGIGANTAIFSAIDTLLLRPLPFRDPERLVNLSLTVPVRAGRPARDNVVWSYPKLAAFRESQTVFSDVTAWFGIQFTLRVGDGAERVSGEFIDSRYLPLLGVQPVLGRAMSREEDRAGGPPVAVISDDLWQWMFNADPAILGKSIDVDGTVYSVIGVMGPGFGGVSGTADFWIPTLSPPAVWGLPNFMDANNHTFFAMGRLAPGVSHERAAAMVRELGARLDRQFPDRGPEARQWGAIARPLDATRVDPQVRRTLLLLFASVGMVLLVACANVASLFLVRAASRRREIAVRLAIGASRWRLVRQLLVESVMLSLLGGVASLAVAWVGVKILSANASGILWGGQSASGVGTVAVDPIRLDLTALAFTAGIAIATGVLFGLLPALQATRPSLTDALRTEGDALAQRRVARRVSTRDVLTVVEIALAVVLLAGSGVLMRSLAHLIAVKPGFDADGVLTMRINRAPAWSRDSITRFYDVALARLREVPGVTHASIADCPPLSGGCGPRSGVSFPERPVSIPGTGPVAGLHWITPDWPTVMSVPLVRGRLLASTDRLETPVVVLISEAAARVFWPGEDPIGRQLIVGTDDTARVVGVVGDVRFGDLQSEPQPEIYVSYYQAPISHRMMLHLRTTGDPAALTAAVRHALREVAPGFPVYDVATMRMRIGGSMAAARFVAQLLSLFAVLALILATIGTYGVISYGVAQRTREMGVRSALGATSGDLIRLVVSEGMTLAAIGGVLGIGTAMMTTRLIRRQLYGVEPTDPVTLAGIVVTLVVAAIVASWLPARRAAGVPAIQALRGG